jgi:hypothetical protein
MCHPGTTMWERVYWGVGVAGVSAGGGAAFSRADGGPRRRRGVRRRGVLPRRLRLPRRPRSRAGRPPRPAAGRPTAAWVAQGPPAGRNRPGRQGKRQGRGLYAWAAQSDAARGGSSSSGAANPERLPGAYIMPRNVEIAHDQPRRRKSGQRRPRLGSANRAWPRAQHRSAAGGCAAREWPAVHARGTRKTRTMPPCLGIRRAG